MRGTIETRVGIFVLGAIMVFMYMGFHVGSFRFDRGRYNKYSMSFSDVSGLSKKAEVKISGVKVGWVEEIRLNVNGDVLAFADVMVLKDLKLYDDAHAIVRQDGFLGPKYIELIPGDPLLRKLDSGDALGAPSQPPVSIDDLLQRMGKIATSVEDITKSLSGAIAGPQGEEQMRETFENIHGITEKLNQEVIPSLHDGMDRIVGRVGSTSEALEDASVQARDGLRSLGSIAEKIDQGKGLLGKLVNEDETYRDLKVAVAGLKNYFAKVDMIQIVVDSHFETMGRPAENYEFEDAKGFFNVRVHPSEDHFYLLQIASSEKGYITRDERRRAWCDLDDNPVPPCDLKDGLDFRDQFRFANTEKQEYITRNGIRLGVQVGKVFGDVALRIGLFEGSAGAAIDFDIPFQTEKLRWVTSFEAYDFRGWNRIDDRRPHLKWLNKVYIMKNLYSTFGADDFISKHNANIFAGFGFRFSDDDLKYLASSIGGCGVAAIN